ncbi:hypothetical protein FBUS_11671 [Fasciolopsis buskii]|uniref:Uncharacterized protein n=1 Tax=Fasciolopsis buskii TaxID=27845 RepID=A0A8E0RLE0_9TREM|nr:hypothetical protein FBUS_11671 [Fasciolopsis buski]
MSTSELRKPGAMKAVAQQLARIHNLNMPFCKQPRFIYKMMDRFLAQLSGTADPPCRPPSHLSAPTLLALEQEYLDDESRLNSSLDVSNFETVRHTAMELGIHKEFEWLKYVHCICNSFPQATLLFPRQLTGDLLLKVMQSLK